MLAPSLNPQRYLLPNFSIMSSSFKNKFYLCISLVVLAFTGVFAQTENAASLLNDSSVIPAKRQPQQNEFLNNQYNFPAKPRNQWEAGLAIGTLTIGSDVAALFPTFGFQAHIRKSLGYLFSIRLDYLNGTGKGLKWEPAVVNSKNPAWLDNTVPGINGNLPNGKGYNGLYRDASGNVVPMSPTLNGGQSQSVFYNYKTHLQDLSLIGLINFNNIRFHKQKTKVGIYFGGGLGFTAYHTMVNALDASGNNYTSLFNSIIAAQSFGDLTNAQKKAIKKDLRDKMDKTYETEAESGRSSHAGLGKNTLIPTASLIGGISYKLSNRVNIALEDRQTVTKNDLLDGQQWMVVPVGDVAQTKEYDSYNFLSLGINYNVGSKSVQPLWWLNPLDYAYSEINQPKHMKLPKPVLDDTDGDGVTDQLDREPNTPEGCPVDSHGVTKDTDGDAVPDCKDKQLITPTNCQPVDADGVGQCSAPACCDSVMANLETFRINRCPSDYQSINVNNLRLDNNARAILNANAIKLKSRPDCTITISGYAAPDKRKQALAAKKIELVKNYLVEKAGISADRISTNILIAEGSSNTIEFQ